MNVELSGSVSTGRVALVVVSVKTTVPVGANPYNTPLAASETVTFCPGCTDGTVEVRTVTAGALVIVTGMPPEVLGAKVASPA